MTIKALATFLVLAMPPLALARLGETERQLNQRFGAPIERTKETTAAQGKTVEFGDRLVFHQGDWTIESVVIDGRCAWESYKKLGDWTETQFLLVLTTNAQGARWTDFSELETRDTLRDWRREDGGTAHWQTGQAMVVVHPAYQRAKERAEARAKAEAARLPKI